jgi:hypothetical protein
MKVIDDINNAKTLEELYEVLKTIKVIVGSHSKYTPREIYYASLLVANRIMPINIITRSFGIREKVLELTKKYKGVE